jgi:hypothetical protein
VASGKSERWTERTDDASALLPLACVFSPNGKLVAYLQNLRGNNQILVAPEPGDRLSALFAKCERRLAP